MAGTFTSLHYHLIFSTKSRIPMIDGDLQPRLFDYLGGIIRAEEGCLIAIGGMPDHVHLLLRWPAKRAVSDLMRVIKSKSSGWVHQTWPGKEKFAWQGAVERDGCDAAKVLPQAAGEPAVRGRLLCGAMPFADLHSLLVKGRCAFSKLLVDIQRIIILFG